jgi:ketosteroid isomerase-like protein
VGAFARSLLRWYARACLSHGLYPFERSCSRATIVPRGPRTRVYSGRCRIANGAAGTLPALGRGMASAHQKNISIGEQLWAAVAAGDAEKFRELFSPEIRWRSHGTGDLTGIFVGVDGVLDYMASAGDLVDKLRSDLIDIFVNDRGVVLWYVVEANRGEKELHSEQFILLEIEGDHIVRGTVIPVSQQQTNSFWTTNSTAAKLHTVSG